MSTVKEHLANLLKETHLLSDHITEADEFVAVDSIRQAIKELELRIHEVRRTFERTKEI